METTVQEISVPPNFAVFRDIASPIFEFVFAGLVITFLARKLASKLRTGLGKEVIVALAALPLLLLSVFLAPDPWIAAAIILLAAFLIRVRYQKWIIEDEGDDTSG